MNTSDFVDVVRVRINDPQKAVFVSNVEFIQAINDGLLAITRDRISRGDPWFLKTILVSPDTLVPRDFLSFAGQYPVTFDSGVMSPSGDEEAVYARYYRSPTPVVSISPTEVIDFPDTLIPGLIQFVSGTLLVRTSMDVTSEMGMADRLNGVSHASEG